MHKSTQQEFDSFQREGIHSKTIISEKEFKLDSICYNYQNRYKLQRIIPSSEKPILKIKNMPCIMVGNQIKKVTEVEYADKKIFIEDTYLLSEANTEKIEQLPTIKLTNSLPSHSENSSAEKAADSNSKKFCLFRKKKGKEPNCSIKRNTKNVAKNFIKSFLSYLRTKRSQKTDSSGIDECIREVRRQVGDRKTYNNLLIWKVISSGSCKEFFYQFLQQHAREWIEQSKVSDKDVHYQAIEIYLGLYRKLAFAEKGQKDPHDLDKSVFPTGSGQAPFVTTLESRNETAQ